MKTVRRLPVPLPTFVIRNWMTSIAIAIVVLMLPHLDACAGGLDGGSATGNSAVAVGPNSTASGDYSTASGSGSTASGGSSTANGNLSTASGDYSTASGVGSTASGGSSTANGGSSTASGVGSTAIGGASTASGDYSTASGEGSTASGYNSTASGAWSTAASAGDIALGGAAAAGGSSGGGNIAIGSANGTVYGSYIPGTLTTASGGSSIAIGTAAQSTGNNSVALGAYSSDGGAANVVSVGSTGQTRSIINVSAATASDQAVNFGQLQAVMTQLIQSGICTVNGNFVKCSNTPAASGALQVGTGASAGYAGSIAMGNNAQITAPTGSGPTTGAIAIGNGAMANADPSVALGNNANATGANSVAIGDSSTATGTTSTALGYNASATGNNAVAIGSGAVASHANSVAIGNGSVTSAPNTVSVGSVGNERRITNLAAGIDPTDAVNVSQLDAALGSQGSGTLASANAYTDQQIAEVLKYAARGIASSMAGAPQISLAPGESGFGLGMGSYDGQSAIGMGFGHMTSGGMQVNLAGSYADGGKPALRAGLGWKW